MSPGTIVCRRFCVVSQAHSACAALVPSNVYVSCHRRHFFPQNGLCCLRTPHNGTRERRPPQQISLSPLACSSLPQDSTQPLKSHPSLWTHTPQGHAKSRTTPLLCPTPRCCHTHRNSIRVHSTTTHTHKHTHKQRTYTPSPPLPPQSPHTPSRCLVPPLMASMNLPRQSAPSLLTSLPHQETLTLP